MKTIIILFIALLTGNLLFAQETKIITAGKIEYQKTINQYAIARLEMGTKPTIQQQNNYEQFKKIQGQFKTLNSTLIFNTDKSLYTPEAVVDRIPSFASNPMGTQFNTIYTDLAVGVNITQKIFYGDQLLIKDTTRKIKWRITNETHDVAGYKCREAHGIILDSVYVVAYFSENIWVSGGPESFVGLPGMIMSLILPREHVRWDAVKVTVQEVPPATLVPPKKGIPLNNKQFYDKMKIHVKDWGQAGPYEMRVFML